MCLQDILSSEIICCLSKNLMQLDTAYSTWQPNS